MVIASRRAGILKPSRPPQNAPMPSQRQPVKTSANWSAGSWSSFEEWIATGIWDGCDHVGLRAHEKRPALGGVVLTSVRKPFGVSPEGIGAQACANHSADDEDRVGVVPSSERRFSRAVDANDVRSAKKIVPI